MLHMTPQKHKLWVFFRSAKLDASNEYLQHVFVEIRKQNI